ncbi:hypothetical protein [Nocardioides sp.]|uniref:hypothetical protein n=1 Tax=Nocardioides sp. TaxID=35761 RepID=UPI002B269401|nr:hypothetical protein [Nocardioides sp.]
MDQLLNLAAPVLALIGGLTLFRALFMPRRFTAKRPFLFFAGTGCLAVATYFYWAAAQ